MKVKGELLSLGREGDVKLWKVGGRGGTQALAVKLRLLLEKFELFTATALTSGGSCRELTFPTGGISEILHLSQAGRAISSARKVFLCRDGSSANQCL
jgi:hypothetical protein